MASIKQIVNNQTRLKFTGDARMGLANKGWRAIIFANRAGLTPRILGGSPPSRKYSSGAFTDSDKASSLIRDTSHFQIVEARKILVGRDLTDHPNISNLITFGSKLASQDVMRKGNQIMIINPCIVDKNGNPDLIILQNRPSELEHQPKSAWSDIKSIGRNTSFCHYTGSEIELHFNTSWYMPGKPGENIPDSLGGGPFNPYWVINQCRKLEAWTMANGYAQSPPVLMIRWGSSDLFRDFLWILKSATYRLRDFHDRMVEFKEDNTQGYTQRDSSYTRYIDQGLIPYSATQELIFQRVSGINLWYNDIMPYRELNEKRESRLAAEANIAKAEKGEGIWEITPSTQASVPPIGTFGNTSKLD